MGQGNAPAELPRDSVSRRRGPTCYGRLMLSLVRSLAGRLSLALVVLSACGTPPPVAHPTPPTPPTAEAPAPLEIDAEFLEAWGQTGGFRYGRPTALRFAPDGGTLFFLRSGARDATRRLFAFDVQSREERVLLRAEQLLETGGPLSPEERALMERLRSSARGITRYELSPDGTQLLVPVAGHLFVYTIEGGAVRELPRDGGYANDARFSPDGTKVACVRDGDIWVIDVAAGTQRKVTTRNEHTTNGLAEFVAQEEMGRYHGYWWSPDGRYLVFQENDNRPVQTLYASNPIRPEQEPYAAPYPRAGTDNVAVRLGILDLRARRVTPRWIALDHEAFPYVATVRWSAGAPLTVLVQDRAQQRERLYTVDPANGRATQIHEETDAAWLNLDQSVPHWIPREEGTATHYLWSSEREGGWTLELRDAAGETRCVFGPIDGYTELLHADATQAFVLASDEPSERHLYRIDLAAGTSERITGHAGQHSAVFGDAQQLWVHISHTLEEGPTYRLVRGHGEGAEVLATLGSEAEEPPFVPQVEHVVVGERELRAMVIRPADFEPERRYPVLVSVYGGPGYNKVRKGRFLQLREQWYANHGFIVVSLDGRGTPGRGRDWERTTRGNLIEAPLGDQVEGLRALGERFAELDLERVGIFGWSFGGYFSAMATMRHPELYRVGIAGAPVCDWRDYDTHYTERFMGLPDENEAGYDAANVLTYARGLERPLMIIHGTSDDNVYFVHALKMSDALLRAARPHEFVVLAGSTHMVGDAEVALALNTRILTLFSDHLR